MGIERKRSFIIQFVYYGILLVIAIALLRYVLPLLTPFVLGFVLASLIYLPTRFLSKKFRLPYKPLALLMVLVFYCTIGWLIALAVIRAFAGVQDLIAMMPHMYTIHLEPALMELFRDVERLVLEMDASLFEMIEGMDTEIIGRVGAFISTLSAKAVSMASNVATSIPGLFLKLVLMIISTFFMAADYEKLTGFCIRQLSEGSRELFHQIKNYLVGTLLVCIGSYIIIILITFTELSIGLSILRIEHALLIAGLIAIFDILPVLGTGGIMIPWSILSFIQGDIFLGVGLLLLYVIITVIRNIVEPKIVGSQLGLHPVVTLASMFAGVQLLGVVGLFGFPICLSLLRYLNDQGSIHIFKNEPHEET